MADITLRNTNFWKSDTPLTSKRVRIILSNPIDSKKMVDAIEKHRRGEDSSFSVSKETQEKIRKAS